MTKQEFLEKLRLALSGKQSVAEVQEHINYYEDYINTEIRKGGSEEEILAALGEPRLIAKTILDAADIRDEQSDEYGGGTREAGHDVRAQSESRYVRTMSGFPAWVWLLLVLIIVIIILGAVFSIISALLPVAIPVLIVIFLIKMFRNGNQ